MGIAPFMTVPTSAISTFPTSSIDILALVAVEIAFTSDPSDPAPVWTDVTSYVQSINGHRGRQYELDAFAAGTASVVLRNDDRRFDPEYSAGPYYGNIKPMRPFRIRGQYAGVTYPMFQGYIDGFPQMYQDHGLHSTVTINATDGFKFLTQADLGTSALDAVQRRDGVTHRWKLNEASGARYAIDDIAGWDLLYQNSPGLGHTGILAGSSDTCWYNPSGISGTGACAQRLTPSDFHYPLTIEGVIQSDNADSPGHDNVIFTAQDGSFVIYSSYGSDPRAADGALSVLGPGFISSLASVIDGQIHHFAYTVNSLAEQALWVDGVNVGVTRDSGPQRTSAGNFPWFATATRYMSIGNYPATIGFGSFSWDDGALAYISAYDHVLTDDKIVEHANAALNGWYDGGTTSDTTGIRIARVLNAADWNIDTTDATWSSLGSISGDVDLDAGVSILGGVAVISGTALAYLQSVEKTENGQLYMSADGKVVFRSRHAPLLDTRSSTSQATFGDTPASEFPYVDLQFGFDDTHLVNSWTVQRSGGSSIRVEDIDSIVTYLRRSGSRTGLLCATDEEARNSAEWLLQRYANPTLRVEKLVVRPAADPARLYPQVLGREIGDRITVVRRPPDFGSMISIELIIESIDHTVDPHGEWLTNWRVSPADTSRYWILGDSTYGVLGTSTKLAY